MEKVKRRYGDRISIAHRAFLLRPEADRSVTFDDYRRGHWERAHGQEEGGSFQPWHSQEPFPSHSLPSAEAAKCAALQGEETFTRYHFALLKAIFQDSRNISDPEVLIELAEGTGLDGARFREDLLGGSQREAVLREYVEGVQVFGVRAIPTVLIPGQRPIVGAVPCQAYEEVIDRLLAEGQMPRNP